jgi:hypothetical protein
MSINLQVNRDDLGVVYCLANDSLSCLKLGKTLGKSAHERAKQLRTTGIPTPFKVLFAKRVINSTRQEKEMHTYFKDYRINTDREFFNITPHQALNYFKTIDGPWDPPPSDDLIGTTMTQSISRTPPIPTAPPTIYDSDPPQIEDNSKPNLRLINVLNLRHTESEQLIHKAINNRALEIKLKTKTYIFENLSSINKSELESRDFIAYISSPEHPDYIVNSGNFLKYMDELKLNKSSAYIRLEEQIKPTDDPEIIDSDNQLLRVIHLITNTKLDKISQIKSKIMLEEAIKKSALVVNMNHMDYQSNKLGKLNPNTFHGKRCDAYTIIKNSSVQITDANIDNVIKELKALHENTREDRIFLTYYK